MNTEQAKQLIHNTFDYPFEEHKFTNFIDDLLTDVDFNESFGYIPPSQNQFKTHVKEYSKVGQYTDPEGEVIDILTAKLHNSYSLEKSRTTLRNFVAEYLKNSIESDGCLIAFNVDGYEDWRFSYIKLQYDLEADSETGKTKAVQKLTPAKRYSFLVGKNEPNHTAQAQMLPLLAKPEKPTLKDIEESFSVDKVTKQFYEDYRKLFEDLSKELNRIVESDSAIKSDFDKHSIEVDNFSKKLLGQIVFLYFLQKKGWLGITRNSDGKYGDWGSGKKNFMRRLYNKEYCEYDNFFNDVLEHLFYNGLGSENSGDVYSKLNSKIPFLNGGLFSPINDYNWQETDIVIENKFIENILDTFDKYNFTVREDNPLDKEVAIDPEMLGRVFENLLPENIRKGKGAFYTPRTIVHYMCQESLINYLDTECENIDIDKIRDLISNNSKEYTLSDSELKEIDSKLHDVKICDPAIGSGAFPVGMMNEIIKTRVYANEKLNKEYTIYDLKRHCISESIYGVDLDSGAIEIAKLRLWLSLIVDEDDYHNIQSLPNLDFKIMQGNSLIEDFHGISLDIEKKEGEQTGIFEGGQELDRLIDDLHVKQLAFLESNHPNEKKKLREKVEESIYNIFDSEIKKVTGLSKEEKQKMRDDLTLMTHGNKIRNFFPWKLYFADLFRAKGGFDIMIANPPYIQLQKNDSILADMYESKNYYTFSRNGDIYSLFIEQGINKINKNGIIVYITSNKWLRANYGKSLREFLYKNTNPKTLIDFGQALIFKSAIVHSNILISQKSENQGDTSAISISNIDGMNLSQYVKNNSFQICFDSSSIWNVLNNRQQILKEKFDKVGTSLKEWGVEISYGIKTGCNKVFIIDELKRKELIKEHYSSEEIIKPILQGRNVRKYRSEFSGKYMIVVYYGQYKTIENEYPAIYRYLSNHKEDLQKRGQCRYGSGKKINIHRDFPGQHHWLELDNNPSKSFFDKFSTEKIVYSEIVSKPQFYYDRDGFFPESTVFFISGKDLLYLTGLLNSKFITFCFKNFYAGGELVGKYRYKKTYIQNLPLPLHKNNLNFSKRIENLVNEIVKKININKDTSTKVLEQKIDESIYELYNLTEEEIQIVESSID